MIATDLVTAVADEVRQAVADVKLPIEHHSGDGSNLEEARKFLRPVTVYEMFLPREVFNDETYYPLVMVEWLNTSDEFGAAAKSISTVGLSMGVFAAETWGWKDALHLTEVVRHRLLTHRTVGEKFRLMGDANWEVAPENPLPFFYTYAVLSYQMFQP